LKRELEEKVLKTTDWKSIVEFLGITAIVASLIFVGLEMRQARQIAMADGALANGANEIERHNSIADNAEIWRSGNSGSELSENDEVVFRSLVQIVHATEFMEIARLRRVGANDIADALTADFSVFLYKNPGARRVWTEISQDTTKYRSLLMSGKLIWDGEFANTVNSHLAKLDQLLN
jgi:hypothetical protein